MSLNRKRRPKNILERSFSKACSIELKNIIQQQACRAALQAHFSVLATLAHRKLRKIRQREISFRGLAKCQVYRSSNLAYFADATLDRVATCVPKGIQFSWLLQLALRSAGVRRCLPAGETVGSCCGAEEQS